MEYVTVLEIKLNDGKEIYLMESLENRVKFCNFNMIVKSYKVDDFFRCITKQHYHFLFGDEYKKYNREPVFYLSSGLVLFSDDIYTKNLRIEEALAIYDTHSLFSISLITRILKPVYRNYYDSEPVGFIEVDSF